MAQPELHLEHHLPGRARLRVARPRTAAQIQDVAARIESLPRVRAVEVTPATGSIMIRFDPEDPVDHVLSDITGLGYLLRDIYAAAHGGTAPLPMSDGAVAVQQVLRRANATVHQATNGAADLRLVIPVALLALAGRQMIRDFRSLTSAPWYTLLYYAFDSFHKLHVTAVGVPSGSDPAPPRRPRRSPR